jgi:hypothetical protein
MADYISCVEAFGGNLASVRNEVARSDVQQSAGRVSAGGSGVVLKGAGAVALGRAAERKLATRLDQKFFPGGTSQCLAASGLFRQPAGANRGAGPARPRQTSAPRRSAPPNGDAIHYDFRAAWRGYNDSLVQYFRQSPPRCDTVSQSMRARAHARLDEITFEARRAKDTAQLQRVESEFAHAPSEVPWCR